MSPDRDLSGLYRAAAREEPPASLDHAILDAARRESRRKRYATEWRHWPAPLALAAVLVLAVTLALVMDGELERTPDASGPAAERDSDVPRVLPQDLKQYLHEPAPAPNPAPNASRASPLRVPKELERAPSAQLRPPDEGRAAGSAPAQPLGATPAPPQASSAQPGPGPLSAEATEKSAADTRRKIENEVRRESELRARVPRPAASEPAQRFANPEQWLREIERLEREGHADEARVLLEAFRKRYPDHPLPRALQ